ncbi:unnamed protein product [Rhodiola kirilowii]
MEHGILSIDTSNTWYEDAPYCLAKHAQQVFYLEDPKFGDNWKVVNVVAQSGTYNQSCVDEDLEYEHSDEEGEDEFDETDDEGEDVEELRYVSDHEVSEEDEDEEEFDDNDGED